MVAASTTMQASVRIIPMVTDMEMHRHGMCSGKTDFNTAQLDGVAVRAEVEQMKPVNS